ncbi:unnamed protein product [Echinostoma caproni]|uniref:Reverse transcriptase domain-containing protein n=1 Tax=Echinostoma caproni TaxID=27848 RepID=A0A183B2B7_9TREM|nr:unnamed protein product [Echinostoma caproni]
MHSTVDIPSLELNDALTKTDGDKSEAFAQHNASVYATDTPPSPNCRALSLCCLGKPSRQTSHINAAALQEAAEYVDWVPLSPEPTLEERWFVIKANKNTKEGVGTLEITEGLMATTDHKKANAFLTFFKENYRPPTAEQTVDCNLARTRERFTEFTVSENDVFRELNTLNRHKAAGPDGLHPAVIQPLGNALEGPMTKLFKESIGACRLPEDWETATVVTIHKSGPGHTFATIGR